MANTRKFDKTSVYKIRVYGNLDKKWADWFDGVTIEPQPGNETLLVGRVADQAALHGMINKIFDLGLPLLAVERIENQS